MKKFILLLIANLLLLSCSQNEESINTKDNQPITKISSKLAIGQNVKLIKAKDVKKLGCSKSGCQAIQTREFVVEVANLAYNKIVAVHQQLSNGQWEDVNLYYDTTTLSGTEIWKGTSVKSVFAYNTPTPTQFGEKIAVKYVVNGQTYWDNNNNQDYKILNTNRQENSSFLYLSNEFNIFITTPNTISLYSNFDLSYLNIAADVRNLGFVKDVKVVYTTNNWLTSSTAPLSFNSIENNNVTIDYELWIASVIIPKTNKVTYALSYTVNGQTYWDNNFGKNYTLTSSN
jgi:Carbohydrate/starch-binding module (family 21)